MSASKPFGVFARNCPTEAEARLDLPAHLKGATYLGLWRIPVQTRPVVHVFSDDFTAADLEADGWERP